MPRTQFLLITSALILIAGCGEYSKTATKVLAGERAGRALPIKTDKAWDAGKRPSPAVAVAPQPVPHLAVINPRKVVYTAEFSVLVRDVRAAVKQTRDLARQTGGYMQQMTNTAIVIRVPADKFNQATDALAEMGMVTHRDIKASDVTEAYMDLQIRIDSAKALLKRMLELHKKAPDIKTALAIEREAGHVRTEIERMMGQLNRMANLATYATISVAFRPMREAPKLPDEFKLRLPLWWLRSLGLDSLLSFQRP